MIHVIKALKMYVTPRHIVAVKRMWYGYRVEYYRRYMAVYMLDPSHLWFFFTRRGMMSHYKWLTGEDFERE